MRQLATQMQSNPPLFRGSLSRASGSTDTSAIAEPEFRPAIRNDVDSDRVREPWWYAVRFNHSRSRVLEPLLKIIDLNYGLFTYEHQRPRRRPTIRSWLPGYLILRQHTPGRANCKQSILLTNCR